MKKSFRCAALSIFLFESLVHPQGNTLSARQAWILEPGDWTPSLPQIERCLEICREYCYLFKGDELRKQEEEAQDVAVCLVPAPQTNPNFRNQNTCGDLSIPPSFHVGGIEYSDYRLVVSPRKFSEERRRLTISHFPRNNAICSFVIEVDLDSQLAREIHPWFISSHHSQTGWGIPDFHFAHTALHGRRQASSPKGDRIVRWKENGFRSNRLVIEDKNGAELFNRGGILSCQGLWSPSGNRLALAVERESQPTVNEPLSRRCAEYRGKGKSELLILEKMTVIVVPAPPIQGWGGFLSEDIIPGRWESDHRLHLSVFWREQDARVEEGGSDVSQAPVQRSKRFFLVAGDGSDVRWEEDANENPHEGGKVEH